MISESEIDSTTERLVAKPISAARDRPSLASSIALRRRQSMHARDHAASIYPSTNLQQKGRDHESKMRSALTEVRHIKVGHFPSLTRIRTCGHCIDVHRSSLPPSTISNTLTRAASTANAPLTAWHPGRMRGFIRRPPRAIASSRNFHPKRSRSICRCGLAL